MLSGVSQLNRTVPRNRLGVPSSRAGCGQGRQQHMICLYEITNVPLTSGEVVGVRDLPGLQLGPLMSSARRLFLAASEEGLNGADIRSCPFRLLVSLAASVPAYDPAVAARTIVTKKLGLRCISVSFDQSGADMMVTDIVSKMNGLTYALIAGYTEP